MFPVWYNQYKSLIDNAIANFLSHYFESETDPALQTIKNATIYACNGGKRIRGILALEFYLLLTHQTYRDIDMDSAIIKFCIVIELLHAYSLVHDDLPAMDNDSLRRGFPTTWKKFGEANAILVGDLLNSLSFELLSEVGDLDIIQHFGRSVGIKGMIGGQVLDLFYENYPEKLTLQHIITTHNKKTGALMQTTIFGAISLANKKRQNKLSIDMIEEYKEFGEKFGLAFQIQDDILDVEGTQKATGKSIGGEKKGFVYFLGKEKSKQYLLQVIRECKVIISEVHSDKLNFLVEYIGKRNS